MKRLTREEIFEWERNTNELTARINSTFARRSNGKREWQDWKAATAAFHSLISPVWELWTPETHAAIQQGDRDAIESALLFLEVDPFFFRSGYLKEWILHRIKRAPLQKKDHSRLQMVILRQLRSNYRREFKFYARLIKVVWTPEFEIQLRSDLNGVRLSNYVRLVSIALDQIAEINEATLYKE